MFLLIKRERERESAVGMKSTSVYIYYTIIIVLFWAICPYAEISHIRDGFGSASPHMGGM